MKTSELLKEKQPVVYSTLYNSLKNGHLSHCYLFVGDKGTYKKETALLLAQSLICQEKEKGEVWGCEQCIDCIRVLSGNYFDLIVLEGTKETIKTEDISKMQQQFDKTALEAAGVKILIIDGAENLTGKSANSLLKMIEEPQGNLTVIFITERIERILPTIVSRCQVINFKPLSRLSLQNAALEKGLDPLSAHLASQLVQSEDQLVELNSDPVFSSALNYFIEFANRLFSDFNECVYYTQSCGFKAGESDNRSSARSCLQMFLSIATIFVHDCLHNETVDDQSWSALLEKARDRKFHPALFLKSVSNAQDCLLFASNQSLVIDQLLYSLREVIK
ncbi:MAG: AAA family ATPase [Erysipelotrichaceae bacterium]|nr:AAA family ATPase [Erysipelotrichaceae bacterium]